MINKKIRELYTVDTISQNKAWGKIQEALDLFVTTNDIDTNNETISIDFAGVNVIDPWTCTEFKQLLRKSYVHMSFVNSESVVNRIKMICIIDGLDENRITNIEVEVPRVKTAEEKKIEMVGTELIPLFEMKDKQKETGETVTVAVLDVNKKYSQMHSTNTINYIEYAIRKLHSTENIKFFTIVLNKISILSNVLEVISDVMVRLETEGVSLEIDSNDEETQRKLGLFIHIATNKLYDEKSRYKAIRNNISINTAGILIKYKKSKAIDEFGRQGKGEVVSSRISIFKGFKQVNEGIPIAIFESYNGNEFYTKQHWMIEHDNELMSKLQKDVVEVRMTELGFEDLFLGSKYHFIQPIQQDKSESKMIIKSLDDNGRNVKEVCTIPRRIQLVFDDWGIEYDRDKLESAIKITDSLLDK